MAVGQWTKKGGKDAPASFPLNKTTQQMAVLTSDKNACNTNPAWLDFGHTLHEPTNGDISSPAFGLVVPSLSFESPRKGTGSFVENYEEVVKLIHECDGDIWNNEKLFDLVNKFFNISRQELSLFIAVELCLNRAPRSQYIMTDEMQVFEEKGIKGNQNVEMLEELQKFLSAWDSTKESSMLKFIYEGKLVMLVKFKVWRENLDKVLKCSKTCRTVSNVIFVTIFMSALILPFVAPALGAGTAIMGLAGLASPISLGGKWCNSKWKNCRRALKRQRELISLMEGWTDKTIKDIGSIEDLVRDLKGMIKSLMQDADFAHSDDEALLRPKKKTDEAVKFLIGEIKTKLEKLTEKVEDLCVHAAECRQHIEMARVLVFGRRIAQSNS